MSHTNEREKRINMFASDIICRHIDRGRLGYKKEIEELLLRILPTGVKGHPIALRKAVEIIPYSHFSQRLREKTLDQITFEEFSNDAVDDLRNMYAYQDRTIYCFAIAEWVGDRRTRLTNRQIEAWEQDENPWTQRLSNLHAKGARACIEEGSILIDDHFEQGKNTLYKLNSGVFQLLQPGIENLKTYSGTVSLADAKAWAAEEIHLDKLFVKVPYQTI